MSQFFKGSAGGGPIGTVSGTPPSTDNAIARYDGTTGYIIQNSGIIIDDDGNLDATATFAGSTKFILLQNNDNTAGSSSKISQLIGGTSAGDIYDEWSIGSARAYSWGVDNDDSQTFKLTTDAAANVDPSSGTSLLEVTSAGEISFPSATLTQYGIVTVGAAGLLESTGSLTGVLSGNGSSPITASLVPQYETVVGGASNALDTVAVGTAGFVLTSNGAGVNPSYQASSFLTTWTVVTAATQALAVSNGYIGNRGTTITYTLPTTAAVGELIELTNIGAGLPVVAQNAGEYINFTASTTTVGVGGSLTAVDQFGSLTLVCVVANTAWCVLSSTGNWTIA